MPIRILPEELASKIAAGQVIERPASVVKELVENALDAGARDIRLEVRGGGQRLIRVADDGSGIPAAEVPTAFARHGTSKLQSDQDLLAIQTLGFRGEALPSISAVARVTLITRAADETNGALYKVENAQTLLFQPHGAPRGTVVTVEDLFRNVPARLKFLKSPGAESGHIAELVYAFALAYPHVRFSLVNDGKLVFQAAGSARLTDVLAKVVGVETAREMIEVQGEMQLSGNGDAEPPNPAASYAVQGYVSPPSLHRGNRRWQYLFVNGRWIQDRALAYAVTEAYHTLLMVGRFPVFVLNVRLPADAVDVNVHPTKMQVRFRDPNEIYRLVQRTVRRALTERFPVPQVAAFTPPGQAPGLANATPLSPVFAPHAPTNGDPAQPGEVAPFLPTLAGSGAAPASHLPHAPALPMLRVLGQIFSTYIICEGPDGLYLVDQHAAHERVLYEKWTSARAQTFAAQDLLEPISVELAPMQWAVLESERHNLAQAGFRLEAFGGQTVLLRAIPLLLARREPRAALLEVLDLTDEGGSPIQAEAEARLIMSICKGAAVKGGQVMSLEEMRALIRDLESTQSPRTCPHGRPTMIQLNVLSIQKEFGRLG